MRITANITSQNSLYNIQQGRAKLDKLNELIGTGYNINRPSDDPVNTALLLDIGDKVKAGDQYQSNITKSNIWQQVTSTALNGMSSTIQLAQKQVSNVANGTSDETTRQTAIDQLKTLKQQLIDMGNTEINGQYIFGGAVSTTAPFNSTAPYYSGDETALKIEIAPSSIQQMNIPGNQLLTADSATSKPYGSTNILKAFDDLIAAIGSNDVDAIQAGAKALEAGAQQVTNAQTDVAARVQRLDSMSTLNENNKNTLSTIYSNTQNVDYAKLAVELSQQQTAFNASLSATAKLSQLSLLDYLS
ncbi:flagellar hook-associated protein FlgL [Geobacter sp. SVR]|uniref:flagellar hook-associated protein FlgL n=1 Tax=Geobacter sp. SVR TaxID=2495594 RepID=UPI00143EF4F3|nr:flagellar hook-associated protein FlgL [Geobacter sp. SVR]BCS55798.1 flagellar hook-associated protein 3 [Geobacter sp. SVR]GCF83802.1 flagellar hook-associated protein 3 [Geobacter sp. SVR]